MLLLHCFESQSKWLVFHVQTRVSVLRADSVSQCFENLFREIYFKEKEKYTKGLCNTFFTEERVRTTTRNAKEGDVSVENGPSVASCFQAKRRSEIPSWPCFPSAEKIPVHLCPTALMVLDPVNMPAKSFIFHGEDEIEFLASIN